MLRALLNGLLSPETVLTSVKGAKQWQVFQELSERIALLSGLDSVHILETLLQREALGSTGIGDGIAIPHGKNSELDTVFCLLARLEQPIDFQSIDGKKVDVIVVMLAPEQAGALHLKTLARISRVLRLPGMMERIRAARNADALYAVLTEDISVKAA